MRLKLIFPICILLLLLIIPGCNREKKIANNRYKLTQALVRWAPYDEGYPLTDKETDKDSAYKVEDYLKYYSDFYKGKVTPPPFNYQIDLSHKSFNELRLLRSEILARHGFLFMDYVLRSHFNATKWYQPVFWYNNFKIKLTDQEKKFIAKVLQLESKKYKQNYIVTEGYKKANTENIVNREQFESIPPEMMKHLIQDGFVINKGNYAQLFHVYDENYYDYTPSFITTDLYLQVLHMHLSKEMQSLEQSKMIPLLTDLLKNQVTVAEKNASTSNNPLVKNASLWNQVYYSVALSLLSGVKQDVPTRYLRDFDYEYGNAQAGEGRLSNFLNDSLMDYTQFQARGNYTRTDSLKRYFKCVKWLNSASIYLDNDESLTRAVLMANAILHSAPSLKEYQSFSNVISFLSGEENNLSIAHLLKVLKESRVKNVNDLISRDNLQKIRLELYAANPRKVSPKGADSKNEKYIARKRLLFTAGRYTFDGEILQRLVHITKPQPKRLFPKALDVFAAMGNKTAENILLNTYKEKEKWESYPDTLNVLKKKFQGFNNWNNSVYTKTMETILTLQKPKSQAPYFMQLPNWQKKDLNTMLGSWTGLKHDMLLYIEQPSGAEMGDGGDIPPPQKIAYLEPQLVFWEKCVDMLQLNEKMLTENGLMTDKLKDRNRQLIEMATKFISLSKKELMGQKLSNKEFDYLSFIGGEVESLTLNIIESGEGTVSDVKTPEKYMAIAADVYTYEDKNGDGKCLEECVGMGDEIYVVAEINGLLYLTRGAVYSHYEFTQPISGRLTDEAWQKQLLDHDEPTGAVWMNDIKINIPHLKTTPNFNLY